MSENKEALFSRKIKNYLQIHLNDNNPVTTQVLGFVLL